MPVLSKHAVLCGDIDFVCLSCEKAFKDAKEAEDHIKTDDHLKNFQTNTNTEKYADECILKVKQRYFCEVCNRVIASSRRLQEHLSDDTHECNKTSGGTVLGNGQLKRVGNQVVAFDDIVASEESWNCLLDDCCVVCDVDWNDMEEHVADVNHVINLIHLTVVSMSGTLFRKIDSQFHCLTCNTLMPKDKLVEHWDSKQHTKLQIQCRKAKRDLDEVKKMYCADNNPQETAKTDSNDLNIDKDETNNEASETKETITMENPIEHQKSERESDQLPDKIENTTLEYSIKTEEKKMKTNKDETAGSYREPIIVAAEEEKSRDNCPLDCQSEAIDNNTNFDNLETLRIEDRIESDVSSLDSSVDTEYTVRDAYYVGNKRVCRCDMCLFAENIE